MAYRFDQDFLYWFLPVDSAGKALSIATLVQSQAPAIYVYDSQPSRTDAAAGSGSPLQTITSWAWHGGKGGWYFTVDGIDDPEPASGTAQRTYWIAINARLDSSEQVQTFLRAVELERVEAQEEPITVTDDDLQAIFPHLFTYSEAAQRVRYVSQAVNRVRGKLQAKGFQWARIHRPSDLKDAVAYRAVSQLLLFLIQQGNDKFAQTYAEVRDEAKEILDGLTIAYDSDGDGKADSNAPAGGDVVWVIR